MVERKAHNERARRVDKASSMRKKLSKAWTPISRKRRFQGGNDKQKRGRRRSAHEEKKRQRKSAAEGREGGKRERVGKGRN